MKTLRRHIVQAVTALAVNFKLGNFLTGELYQGKLKYYCVPFLNCYSCPAAVGACPLGSLQSLAAAPVAKLSLYVLGGMIAAGGLAGRLMCGWLCPFGFLQDLLAKLSRVKLFLPRWLIRLKYFALPLVVLLPILLVDAYGFGAPYFCQYICPAGTLTAGIPLMLTGRELWPLAGFVFWWKIALLLAILLAAVFIYRPFCRILCPLGAFWGLFNRVSLFRLTLAGDCSACVRCTQACPVGLSLPEERNSAECIRCMACTGSCPHGALQFKPELWEERNSCPKTRPGSAVKPSKR
jgi:ferredoxin-type protein NapH